MKRFVIGLAVLTLVIAIGGMAWLIVDLRNTNHLLVANDKAQAKQLRQAEKRDDERVAEERRQTNRDLRTILRSLREVVRQLGGDPSGIPPENRNDSSPPPNNGGNNKPPPNNGNGNNGNGNGHGNGNGNGGGEPKPLDPVCDVTGLC